MDKESIYRILDELEMIKLVKLDERRVLNNELDVLEMAHYIIKTKIMEEGNG